MDRVLQPSPPILSESGRMRNLTHLLAGVTIGTLMASPPLFAQDGKALFTDNCAPCHAIGAEPGVGPDLRDLGRRRNSDWLTRFILDPEGVTKSGDPYAVALAKKYDGVIMPPPPVTREQIAAILQYIDAASSTVAAAATPPPAEPVFTAEDLSRGRALFIGSTRLTAGGPSCMSCHVAGGEPGLGGGALGPSLGTVVTRLNGAKGTEAWLASPPTPVMRSVFRSAPLTPAEVTALTAFLTHRAADGPSAAVDRAFPAAAVAVAVVLLYLIGFAWRRRLRPVRRALISGGQR
jgi:mono/diheme cytochrome c family protein